MLMLDFICFNHKITRISEAVLPAASAAAFYGRGIFTTVAVARGELFQWGKHWRRLKRDAALVSLDLSVFEEEEITHSLAATIAANNLSAGRVRLTFFDRSLSGAWNFQPENKIDFLIVAAGRRAAPPNLCLTISPYPVNSRSPLAGVKSCNYLENLLALERAKGEGFDEAVRLNEKSNVVSACLANIFTVKNGELFTTPLDAGALAGTTRAFVLENFSVIEKQIRLEDLNQADEIFLTSAGVGAARVERVGEIKYNDSAIFERVRRRFLKVLEI